MASKKMVSKKLARTAAGPPGREAEMKAKASEVSTTYGKGVLKALEAGRLLAAYQHELADRKLFHTFWRSHLKWPKTRVYRLINAAEYFGGQAPAVLGMFDLSALYTLSGEGDLADARAKAVEKAEAGEFITNGVANKLLGRVAAKGGTPGRVTVTRRKLAAEAKKLKLDPKAVLELFERLGVTVDFGDTRLKRGAA